MAEPAADLAGLPFGWGAIFALLNLLLGGGAVVAWVKTRPKMRELEIDSDRQLRADLVARVERLERLLDEERRRFEVERARHEAAIGVMRHRANNSDQCLDALLLLLEAAPERVAEAVASIKEMRARHRAAEALEKGALHAAELTVSASTGGPLP